MRLPEFFQDKYTVIFILIVVLLASVWVSRTYRNGGFGSWIAPSEGYGTGVIEGFDQASAVTNILESFTASSHGPATAVASATSGELVLNKCERIWGKNTTFRFIIKPVTSSQSGDNRTFTILIPKNYIQTSDKAGVSIILRKQSPLLASGTKTITSFTSETPIETVASTNIELTRAETEQHVKIIYKIKPETQMIGGTVYTIEITNLKWVSPFNNPTASSLLTLTSSMEPADKNQLVAIELWNGTDEKKQVKIFKDSTFDLLPEFGECRKITTTPLAELVESDSDTAKASTTRSQTVFKLKFMLTNPFGPLDLMMVQLPNLSRIDGTTFYVKIVQGSNTFASFQDQQFWSGVSGSLPYATFKLKNESAPILANALATLYIYGIRTPETVVQSTSTGVKIRTFARVTVENPGAVYGFSSTNFLDAGEYTFPSIASKPAVAGSADTSGSASDGTSYVASASSSILISDVKRQMNWAIDAQNEYESTYKALRAATTTPAKADAQLKYDNAVARRNRLLSSHPDSWYDGSNWRYGDDGYVRKCVEPSNLSSNEGNCRNIFRMDASGNVVKSADGSSILLMKKCPWKCNNPGQSGSDSCRIDADCLKIIRWATYLPDGTQIEKNLLATTRSKYDEIAEKSDTSALDDDDIYRRGITRNFRGYGKPGSGQPPAHTNSPGLFGTIRDAAGNIIRSVGNWIDPNDPAANKRTNRHNAYYYEDGSPAATAYLGMYNGQSYDEESPFYAASKPTNYYYTTNYYYSDANPGEGATTDPKDSKSNVKPYEQIINL
jgi:hypothetical protein